MGPLRMPGCPGCQAETALRIRAKALPGRPAGGRENKGGGSGRPPSNRVPSLGGCTKRSCSQATLAEMSGQRGRRPLQEGIRKTVNPDP